MTYMSDERRRDAAKRSGPFGAVSGKPPCGVAHGVSRPWERA